MKKLKKLEQKNHKNKCKINDINYLVKDKENKYTIEINKPTHNCYS